MAGKPRSIGQPPPNGTVAAHDVVDNPREVAILCATSLSAPARWHIGAVLAANSARNCHLAGTRARRHSRTPARVGDTRPARPHSSRYFRDATTMPARWIANPQAGPT